jgi:hypothetical protein
MMVALKAPFDEFNEVMRIVGGPYLDIEFLNAPFREITDLMNGLLDAYYDLYAQRIEESTHDQ